MLFFSAASIDNIMVAVVLFVLMTFLNISSTLGACSLMTELHVHGWSYDSIVMCLTKLLS